MTQPTNFSDIGIFMPSFGDGGAERMMVNLARGLAASGLKVDFLISRNQGPFLPALDTHVRVVELGSADARKVHAPLVDYLIHFRPVVLLSAKGVGREALRARREARAESRLVIRIGTTISQNVAARNPIKRFRRLREMRRFCPRADAIIAVSKGVAEDIHLLTGVPLEDILILNNPVITPEMERLAVQPVDHPWFAAGEPPVILGAGGLRKAKGFDTLIRAFALVRNQRAAKLIILGKGRQHRRLEKLARKLGVSADVSLPGFVSHPYGYMARAAVFVLSSLWEGSPNVLTEALALGTSVVATDCRSGPSEILQQGRYGRLVKVGEPAEMARAVLDTLKKPMDGGFLRSAAAGYTLEASAAAYGHALGLRMPRPPHQPTRPQP